MAEEDLRESSMGTSGAPHAAGELDDFGQYLTRLREQRRRQPAVITILDKADLR
jgi:hypothetical protein